MDGFLIEVKGEIKTIDSTPQYAADWICGSIGGDIKNTLFTYDSKKRIIVNDLALSKNLRAIPYAIYYTKNGIEACKGDLASCGNGCCGAYTYFTEHIGHVKKCLSFSVPTEISNSFYNGLYVEITSIIELFLCDALMSCIYSNEQCFKKAEEYYLLHSEKKKDSPNDNIHLYNYFQKNFVYHRYNKVKLLFETIVEITFPSFKEVKTFLNRRDNIVHRFALAGNSRMEVTNADKSILEEYLIVAEKFANSLYASIENKLN